MFPYIRYFVCFGAVWDTFQPNDGLLAEMVVFNRLYCFNHFQMTYAQLTI